jgi:hypothetical protein
MKIKRRKILMIQNRIDYIYLKKKNIYSLFFSQFLKVSIKNLETFYSIYYF